MWTKLVKQNLQDPEMDKSYTGYKHFSNKTTVIETHSMLKSDTVNAIEKDK